MANTDLSDADDGTDERFIDLEPRSPPALTLDDLDGLADQKTTLRRTVCQSLCPTAPVGTDAGASALLYGPPDVGKTRLALAVAGTVGADYYHLRDTEELDVEDADDVGAVVADVASDATPADPTVVVLDCVDDLYGSGYAFADTLRSLREDHAGVAVVATMCPDRVRVSGHERWLRAFDVRIEVPRPDEARRRAVLESTLADLGGRAGTEVGDADGTQTGETGTRVGGGDADVEVDVHVDVDGVDTAAVAESTEEFTVRELRDVGRRALAIAGDDATVDGTPSGETGHTDEAGASLQATDGPTVTVETAHLEAAVEAVEAERAEHLRTGGLPFGADGEESPGVDTAAVPEVSYDDVGGLEEAKRALREAVEFPERFPGLFEGPLDAGRGILLSGPPGTGKTMLARALAHETDRTFLSVAGPELQDKYVGETERHIRELFDRAREHAPSIVFFDEFDSLAPRRADADAVHYRDFVNTLLAELDGLETCEDVVVVAATNRPDALDRAVLRPGRIDRHVEVTPPDRDTYVDIVRVHLRDLPTAPDLTPEWVADRLPAGLVGADIAAVCEQAAYAAMRTADRPDDDDTDTDADGVTVTRRDVETALAEFEERGDDGEAASTTPGYR